jgi:hypothetical protein
MEILSVQNQFQSHQFGVLSAGKTEVWTKPLTNAPSKSKTTSVSASGKQPLRQQSSSPLPKSIKSEDDTSRQSTRMLATQTQTALAAGKLSKSATTPIKSATSRTATGNAKLAKSKSTSGVITSNSNSDDSNSESGLDIDTKYETFLYNLPTYNEDAIQLLAIVLEKQLREAKLKHLACTEVLLPCGLLNRIAVDMLDMADSEPCGIRGCNIIIEFEDEPANTRRIASLKVDQNTVSTFELYLTIKQDRSGWTSILPQFLKNLTRGGTIMISREYMLVKNKLYYSFSD